MIIKKSCAFVVIITFFCSLFSGCKEQQTPPSVEEVEQLFLENYADIQTVVSFALNSNYESIYIHGASGTMSADYADVSIEDEAALAAVKRLLSNKIYKTILVDKEDNAIYLVQWTRFTDAGCGVAYSINGVDKPKIQYCTQLIPLSKDGWYYCVDDYNEWRVTHSTD